MKREFHSRLERIICCLGSGSQHDVKNSVQGRFAGQSMIIIPSKTSALLWVNYSTSMMMTLIYIFVPTMVANRQPQETSQSIGYLLSCSCRLCFVRPGARVRCLFIYFDDRQLFTILEVGRCRSSLEPKSSLIRLDRIQADF